MRNRLISLALAMAILFPHARSQWVQANGPDGVRAFATNGDNLFAGNFGSGVFRSTDGGTGWTPMNSGMTSLDVTCLGASGPNLVAGTDGGGVFLSTDGGTSWNAVNSGLANKRILSLAFSGTNWFAGTSGNGVFRSADNGTNWIPANSGVTYKFVHSLVGAGINLFAGTSGSGAFVSTNNGASWAQTGLTNTYVMSLAVIGPNLFAGTWGGLFCSTDSGTGWIPVNSGITSMWVNCLAVNGTDLFAGTSHHGVFCSSNNVTSCTSANTGLPVDEFGDYRSIECLAVSGTNLVAGIKGAGVWRRPLSQVVSVNSTDVGPSVFRLSRNYPNPFNPSTTIRYDLPKAVEVRLSVYDMLGREVSVLVDERRDAGIHEVMFDASGLPSGVYLCRLRAGDFVQTRKLLLLK